MGKLKIMDLITNTIDEIQQNNRNNPNEKTAQPSVFDLLKGKLRELEGKTQANVKGKEGRAVSLFDLIKGKIDEARQKNHDDPNQETAPTSIFDQLKKKVADREQVRSEDSISEIIDEYNIDVRNLNNDVLRKVQANYHEENRRLDVKYANIINDLNNRYR